MVDALQSPSLTAKSLSELPDWSGEIPAPPWCNANSMCSSIMAHSCSEDSTLPHVLSSEGCDASG